MPQRERPLCEGCGVKEATFGTPTERKRRWCGGCGKAHGAMVSEHHAEVAVTSTTTAAECAAVSGRTSASRRMKSFSYFPLEY